MQRMKLPTRIQPVRLRPTNKENKNHTQRRIATQYCDDPPVQHKPSSKPCSLLKGRTKATSTEGCQRKYRLEEVIGKGTFGVVYKGRDQLGKQIAVKKVLQDKNFKNRQQQILGLLSHKNVLAMRDSFFTKTGDKVYLNVVMDYYPQDLYSFIRSQTRKKAKNSPDLVKQFARQMFQGLQHLRSLNICHRDIKPHNVLVDPQRASLVICDFGSAKILSPSEPNISYICSRSYRAPELILGATHYSTQVDVWSMACVLMELLTGKVLFNASSNIEQMLEIVKFLGTPSSADLNAMNPALGKTVEFPAVKAVDLGRLLKGKAEEKLVQLLGKLLVYDPAARLTPSLALQHPYFSQRL